MDAQQEFRAPWGRLLKGMSGGVVVLFIGIVVAGKASIALLVFFPLILLLALPFIIRGYAVSESTLTIRRLGWSMMIPLDDLQSAEAVPNAMRGSIRLFGNGGLFSITGLYRSKSLGKYRAFVTDLNRTVVLRFSNRIIVVSPDDPAAFVQKVGKSK